MDTQLLFIDAEILLRGILTPLIISLAAGVARVALWGWKGARHFVSNLFVGCFAGVIANWALEEFSISPTTKAVIISFAALTGSETIKNITSPESMRQLLDAFRARLFPGYQPRCHHDHGGQPHE